MSTEELDSNACSQSSPSETAQFCSSTSAVKREQGMTKRTSTTKDVALLHQLFSDGQLKLAAEFQRNAVWPRPAKAYLIDTILNDRPIPLLFFQRTGSAQTGRPSYTVIDGQQRLRALFDFIDNRFRLTQSSK